MESENVQGFLDQFMPGSKINSIRLMEGSFSNFTHLIEVEPPGASAQQIVLRRYNPANGQGPR